MENGIVGVDMTISELIYKLGDGSEFLNTSIYNLNLSVRTYNCLIRDGVKTIKDFAKYKTEHDLIKVKNLGRKSLKELVEILNKLGIRMPWQIRKMPEFVPYYGIYKKLRDYIYNGLDEFGNETCRVVFGDLTTTDCRFYYYNPRNEYCSYQYQGYDSIEGNYNFLLDYYVTTIRPKYEVINNVITPYLAIFLVKETQLARVIKNKEEN